MTLRPYLGLLGETDTSDARYLLDHLTHKGRTEFTPCPLHVELPHAAHFATAGDVTAAVTVLR